MKQVQCQSIQEKLNMKDQNVLTFKLSSVLKIILQVKVHVKGSYITILSHDEM